MGTREKAGEKRCPAKKRCHPAENRCQPRGQRRAHRQFPGRDFHPLEKSRHTRGSVRKPLSGAKATVRGRLEAQANAEHLADVGNFFFARRPIKAKQAPRGAETRLSTGRGDPVEGSGG